MSSEAPGPSPHSDNYLATYAATTIQRRYRGYRVRRQYLERRNRIRKVELDWAQHHDLAYRTNIAARIIQTAWRGFRNKRIYQYYRDLIRFRERGDPRELLRVINPREAQLVDAAAGIHVRFRLGGTVFPPLVFYKIFTHRPVMDVCAFGPRDYANEVRLTAAELHNRPPGGGFGGGGAGGGGAGAGGGAGTAFGRSAAPAAAAAAGSAGSARAAAAASRTAGAAAGGGAAGQHKNVHTFREGDFELEASYREYIKPDGTIGLRSTRGWYERHENNGWRPVAERVLLDEDPVTTMTRLRRQPMFHHSPAVRREQRAALAKQRKREWLRKVYAEGAAGGKAGGAISRPASALAATGGATAGSSLRSFSGAAGSSASGDVAFPDWEINLDELDDVQLDRKVDELLAWSQHLDYGSYFEDWTSLACTLASEAFAPEDEGPYIDEIPAPRGDVRAAMQAAGAPMVPFKGGATAAGGTVVSLRS